MNELDELRAAVKKLRELAQQANNLADQLEAETCYASGLPSLAVAASRLVNGGAV